MAAAKKTAESMDAPKSVGPAPTDAGAPEAQAPLSKPSPPPAPSEPSAFVTVTPVHGIIEHDGSSYKPGEPCSMLRAEAARLGARVKHVGPSD